MFVVCFTYKKSRDSRRYKSTLKINIDVFVIGSINGLLPGGITKFFKQCDPNTWPFSGEDHM